MTPSRADVILTQAFVRAANLLDLPDCPTARLLGVRPQKMSRLRAGEEVIAARSKRGEFASLLVRAYVALDQLAGGDAAQRRAWMHGYNRALNQRPVELVQSVQGLVSVVTYLEAMQTS
jgi:hypothetical protein